MNALGPERLDQILDKSCALFGEHPALVGTSEAYTYAQLRLQAEAVKDNLLGKGVAPEEPVIVAIANEPSDIIALYGVWKAGAVAVPLHIKAGPATVTDILERTAARFIVRGTGEAPLPTGIGDEPSEVVVSIKLEAPDYRSMLNDGALVIFTSGSTGRPKGVVLSQRAFSTKLSAIQSIIPFSENDSTLLVLQLTFSFGQWVSWLTLATGGTLFLMPRFDPISSLSRLKECRIKRIAVVPTMMRSWAALAEGEAAALFDSLADLSCPDLLIAGGEPLPGSLGIWFRKRLPHLRIADVFGLTETSTSDFILAPDKYDELPGTIGFPSPGVEFYVASDGAQEGGQGELMIRTPHIMNGYLDDPATTAASFKDGFLATGDLARVTESGAVMLTGRQKELIVRGGNKISPVEIERVFGEHPHVVASLATGMPDERLGERIDLLIIAKPGTEPTQSELQEWARTRLDRFKVPDRIHFADELPLGRTGKVDRQQLKLWLTEREQLLAKQQASLT